MKEIYVIGMQTGHGCELTHGACAYQSREKADEAVKKYHEDGLHWMKVFTLRIQD